MLCLLQEGRENYMVPGTTSLIELSDILACLRTVTE